MVIYKQVFEICYKIKPYGLYISDICVNNIRNRNSLFGSKAFKLLSNIVIYIILSRLELVTQESVGTYYTVIHSSDPEKTAAWLESEFSDLSAPNSYWPKLLTPDDVFDGIIKDKTKEIITSLITMAVLLVLMSICMYFIMRSSLMNRIKEVGIYRAIGVSKKNLVFKFFIEAVVLATLTVFIGYLVTSGFLFVCLGMSSLVADIFYYPLWLAGAILTILYVISLFFGTLPIISLLRKTPSEILAKYDI